MDGSSHSALAGNLPALGIRGEAAESLSGRARIPEPLSRTRDVHLRTSGPPMSDATREEECVIALDVGGTGMKGALLDQGMRPLDTTHRPTPRADGPPAVLDAMVDTLLALNRMAVGRGLWVRHAGVVVPGIVDDELQRAVWSANIGWRDLPLAALLEERSGLPVTLGHDVRAGGAAECALGAARGARNVLFVAIGTGIAAALVCDGEPIRAGGYAGELGHVVVESGERRVRAVAPAAWRRSRPPPPSPLPTPRAPAGPWPAPPMSRP